MDEEKAVKTLAAVLAKHLGIQVVQDKMYKEKLIKNSFYAVQFSEPFIIGYDQFYMKEPDSDGNKYRFGYSNTDRTKKQYTNIHHTIQEAVDAEEKYKGANYFFADNPVQEKDRGLHISITPYSIIGHKEARNLRHLFYKNVPPDIMSAIHTLGIMDYTDIYKAYYSKWIRSILEGYHAYLKLESLSNKLDFERTDYPIPQSRLEELIGMDVGEFNKQLEKNIYRLVLYEPYSKGERYALEDRIGRTKNELKSCSSFSKWIPFLPDFLNFVFTLPLEDQNVENNKKILGLFSSENVDYIGILSKEYSEGKNFQDYFNCLTTEQQEKLIDSLKTLPERKPLNDSFLWSKGFKNLSLDYLTLYKTKSEEFIDYFKTRTFDEKKAILKDIMDYEFTNEEVINWLNKNEQDLIREVGFNG
ncbi:hypothetical protein FJZ53_01590 [Candidatus Woesearchaeota archaeon]|nr:hypothetical protein [Candidatus Woesearchaeota archaeon]